MGYQHDAVVIELVLPGTLASAGCVTDPSARECSIKNVMKEGNTRYSTSTLRETMMFDEVKYYQSPAALMQWN